MSVTDLISFIPELVLLAGALVIFIISLGERQGRAARRAALATAFTLIAACAASLGQTGILFDGAYRVDLFSQWLKLLLAITYALVLMAGGPLPDIRREVKAEYHLLLACSMIGLLMLVSSVEIVTLVIALELSSFPLFLMVPMRREQGGHRNQMEAAAKYIMLGVAATGIMLFGFSYLLGLTGSLHLSVMLARLPALLQSPVALIGLGMVFCGIYFKLALFPFHSWSPDVYQGAATETVTAIASLPKVGALAILIRLSALVESDYAIVAGMFSVLAMASMFYGNLIALAQKDLKRLLGFSAIAHAGYAMVGCVAFDAAGCTAALYYIFGYVVMTIACFAVITQVFPEGGDVQIADLAGLHQRSPLLAATLAVGMFGLAGIPPLAGFMGKVMLLKAALNQGELALAIVLVINTALAIYYYLQVIREAYFREADQRPAITMTRGARVLCYLLMLLTLSLGLFPGPMVDRLLPAAAFTLTGSAP